jgi:hypothetical protein
VLEVSIVIANSRRLVLALLLLLIAMVLGRQLIYELLIVPRLPETGSAPGWWWAGLYGPPLLVCILVGTKLKAWLDLLLFSGAAALLGQVYQFVFARGGHSGLLKSYAVEDPVLFWTVGTVMTSVVFLLSFGVGMAIRKLVKNADKRTHPLRNVN